MKERTEKNHPVPAPSEADRTRNELESLNQAFTHATSGARDQQSLVLTQVNGILERQQNWMQRLTLAEAEKRQLDAIWKKQEEAIVTVLESRNQSIRAVGDAQVRFVREVCNSLLLVGRSDLQSTVRSMYLENALALQQRLEDLNLRFWDLLEAKMQDAEERPELLRPVLTRQCQTMIEQWNQRYETILEEFGQLINEKV